MDTGQKYAGSRECEHRNAVRQHPAGGRQRMYVPVSLNEKQFSLVGASGRALDGYEISQYDGEGHPLFGEPPGESSASHSVHGQNCSSRPSATMTYKGDIDSCRDR